MSTAARVDSTDAIKDFRVYLTKFQESANLALGDADSDVNRTVRWLEGEGLNLWLSTIRKRQEEVAKAEEAFRFKRLYKDASGSMPSAIEEQKAVQNAKKRLAEAQEKLASVKKWTRQLQKEIVMYRGGVSRFAGTVSSGVPAAIAHLGTKLDELDKYMEISAGPAGEGPEAAAAAGGAVREGAGASMARCPKKRLRRRKPKPSIRRRSERARPRPRPYSPPSRRNEGLSKRPAGLSRPSRPRNWPPSPPPRLRAMTIAWSFPPP